MPRSRRIVTSGSVLHVVNRGNDRRVIFPEPVDYAAFLVLLREARERFPVKLFAYCLMPNHFHLVVTADTVAALSAYMHYLQREHAYDLRACARTLGHGHIFQRRYWSSIITGDGHLLCVLRYVEANAARAGLVGNAQLWEWGSLWDRETGERDLLHPLPIRLPPGWSTIVNVPLQQVDLDPIRHPVKMGRPPGRSDLRSSKK
jgi:putative transposase